MGLKPDAECRSCFRRGFEDYVSRAGLSRAEFNSFIKLIDANLEEELPPPLAGAGAWKLLRKASLSGNDIFQKEKAEFTDTMLSVYEELKDLSLKTDSPSAEALSAATWCNILDVGQGKQLPDTRTLLELFRKPLFFDERREFLERLKDAESLLILGDNAGETVMDRLFLELSGFQGKRYYMTRDKPVMNDALVEDARAAGLHLEAHILSSGTDFPAVVPELLQGHARRIYRSADLILAKGQGNLEGLFGLFDHRVYHSFVVKCQVVSSAVGADMGEGVFRRFMEREV